MISKNIQATTKLSPGATAVLAGLTLIIAVLLLVVANSAFANRMKAPGEAVITGEVVAVDTAQHLTTVTLRSSAIGQYPNDELNVFVTGRTKVNTCSMSDPGGGIAVSRPAIVKYHELRGWLAVADSIAEKC